MPFLPKRIRAHRGQTWAFVTGMVLFTLDALILLFFQDLLGVGVHAVVLYFLFRGFRACRAVSPTAC